MEATNGAAASEYVTLVSSDGFEFIIRRESACISEAIKKMLNPISKWIEGRNDTR
jgi:transcription elongation factor B subunit 1